MGLITKEITRKNGEVVKVEDLTLGSGVGVEIECDGCTKILTNVKWVDYLKCVKEDGKYFCNQCAKNGFKKWISFFEWCYINLPKEIADRILDRWDYKLNVDKDGKSISPKDVSHGSNKPYWFKCLDNSEHVSEQKNINTFTNGKQVTINCHQCDSISTTYPHMLTFLVNEEDGVKFSVGSDKKTLLKCPNCGYEKLKNVYDWLNKGFGCPKCSDGVSYPNKFMFNILEQIQILKNVKVFETEKTFDWLIYNFKEKERKGKLDFYLIINDQNYGIEMDGGFHSKDNNMNGQTKEESKYIDNEKDRLCREHDVTVIRIDSSKSEMDWIKNSIMSSRFPILLGFKSEDIDWLKCHEWACNSLVKVVCDMRMRENKSNIEISSELKLHVSTIIRYLKQGVELGWCDYNGKEALTHKEYQYKKVVCLTTNEIFDSILDASIMYDIHKTSISACCRRNENKSAGKHPDNESNMVWMFYDEFILKTEEEIQSILNKGQDKKIICLTTKEVFNNNTDASQKYKVYKSGISACCNGKAETAGKHFETKEKLKWMFYEDYLKL